MTDLTKLRAALGLAEDITDDQVVDWLASVASTPPEPPAAAPAPPAAAPAPLPEGVVAIDATQLEQLRNDAQAGVAARAEQLRQHRNTAVDAAVADGRIAPARRDAWVAQLEADPGAEQVLTALAKGTIPVEAIGSSGAADLDTQFAEYDRIYGKEVKV